MTGFALRFLGAGLLVGALPFIAGKFGDRTAGLVLLFPAVTVAGFLVLGLTRGTPAVGHAALGALTGLPVVAVFLVAVAVMARHQSALPSILAAGVGAWLLAAVAFATVSARVTA